MSDTDLELLARFARDRADEAFAELVRRHLNLVHSAALRQVRSPQLAEEVAQSTFLKLAQHARQLAPGTVLSAWLYQITRREAIDVVRREARRQLREQIATEMNAINVTASDWTHIEPLLDDAMAALDETDRILFATISSNSPCTKAMAYEHSEIQPTARGPIADDSPQLLTYQRLHCLDRPDAERSGQEPLAICDDLINVVQSERRASLKARAPAQGRFTARKRYLRAVISHSCVKGVFDPGDIERRLGRERTIGKLFGDNLPTVPDCKGICRDHRSTHVRLIRRSLLSFEKSLDQIQDQNASAIASPLELGAHGLRAEHLLDMASIMDQLNTHL
jgi:RNA polymerase sigma factor (sigma-70 family)